MQKIYKPIKHNSVEEILLTNCSTYEKNLKQIYMPIKKELDEVEKELKKQVRSIIVQCSKFNHSLHTAVKFNVEQIFNHFFKIPGKRLRPALVILSAKSVNSGVSSVDRRLIQLAAAVELIHNASLIHDDIVDDASFRRGQLSLNKQFGNQIAVLVGDMIYTRALLLLINNLDKKIFNILLECVEEMCCGELNELRIINHKPRTTEYLKIIGDKTASFMSACCKCGAMLNGADKKLSEALANYGFNFGMAYQIIDDYIDGDNLKNVVRAFSLANKFASMAKLSIKDLKSSIYKEKLYDLVDHVLIQLKVKTETEFIEENTAK